MEKLKVHFKENCHFYLLWAAFTAVFCVLVFPQCSADFISYDSSYQYFLTQHNMSELWQLLPLDYSPPFYATSLKLFTLLFGNTLYVMRVYNLLAVAGMLWIAAFPVRRAFGAKAAVCCSVLVTCNETVFFLLREIRPTYFAMFFVMGAGIYAYLSFFEGRKSDYILHAVFSILAMYTHNVGMLSALAVYAAAILFSAAKRNFSQLRAYFISGITVAVLYAPWLVVVFKQFGNVREGFWVSQLDSWGELFSWTVGAPFNFQSVLLRMLLSLAIAVLLVLWMIKNIRWKSIHGAKTFSEVFVFAENKPACIKAAFVIVMYIMAAAVLLLFSAAVYPIATERYCYVFLGLLFIVVSAWCGNYGSKTAPVLAAAVLLINFAYSDYMQYDNLQKNSDAVEQITDVITTDGTPAILHYHEGTVGILSYFYPDAEHYVCDDTNTVLQTYDVFTTDIIDVGSAENIKQHTDEFYVFSVIHVMAVDGDTSEANVRRTFPNATLEHVGSCELPYSFLSGVDIIKVTL